MIKASGRRFTRKQLAQELGYTGALDGSTDMNVWLHKQVMVKLAESVLVLLLCVHLLGGLRVLVIENLPWRNGQKALATAAVAVSVVVALVFLVRLP